MARSEASSSDFPVFSYDVMCDIASVLTISLCKYDQLLRVHSYVIVLAEGLSC